ncbi:MAG: aminopeptidase P family N-terminal domain-containing protein, partial [Candidatus Hodarchaeota archaeon]
MKPIKIPQKRFEERQQEFIKILEKKLNLRNFIIINPRSIYYLTGFSMIQTERPFLVIFKGSSMNFFVPELEKQHVLEEVPNVDNLGGYFEYPDITHPMIHFNKFIKEELDIKDKIGAEGAGAPGMWGYQGPSFKDALKVSVEINSDIITDMRIIKDSDEIASIRESARWGGLAHKLLQE